MVFWHFYFAVQTPRRYFWASINSLFAINKWFVTCLCNISRIGLRLDFNILAKIIHSCWWNFSTDKDARYFYIVSDNVSLSHSLFTELLLCLNFGAIIWPKWSGINSVNSILDWFSFLFRLFPIILLLLTSSLRCIIFFMIFIITLIDHSSS